MKLRIVFNGIIEENVKTDLGNATGELGHFDLLLGEIPLETGEYNLTLTRLKSINQT